MHGDRSHFIREDAVEETWRIVQPLIDEPPPVERLRAGLVGAGFSRANAGPPRRLARAVASRMTWRGRRSGASPHGSVEEVTLKLPGTDHRVVIVGAGLRRAVRGKVPARRAAVEVTLIDRTNHHLFQPLLYQVATGILSAGAIAPATRDVLRKHKNIAVEMGEVTGFDLDAKRVTATRPDGRVVVLEYDSLIVGAGVGGSYFGHDEFAEFAPGMKTLADALDQRDRIFGAFEMAELEEDPERAPSG